MSQTMGPEMNRTCGSGTDRCTLCCRLLPVRELEKGANERCVHQRATGCKVYHQHGKGFPISCAIWSCRWLNGGEEVADLARPDRTHYVIDMMPTAILLQPNGPGTEPNIEKWAIQVWVDPRHRDAWKDTALLAYIEAKGMLAILRFDEREDATVLCPPQLADDGQWHEQRSNLIVEKRPPGDDAQRLFSGWGQQ